MGPQTEQFRIVATVGQEYTGEAADRAAGAVLDWAGSGLEKPLPKQAWTLEPFKHFAREANCNATRVLDGERDIWAIRVNRADDAAPKGLRSVEAVVQRYEGQRTTLTVRQLVDRKPWLEAIPPEAPAFVHSINANLGLYSQWTKLESEPWIVGTGYEFEQFVAILTDSERKQPVFVLSVPEGSGGPLSPLLDAGSLARATTGLATVVVLPPEYAWELTTRFGKELSVYLGAARVYRPGFDRGADPFAHELELVQRVESPSGRAKILARLQRTAAEVSLEHYELGTDLLAFDVIRKEAAGPQPPVPAQSSTEGTEQSVTQSSAEAPQSVEPDPPVPVVAEPASSPLEIPRPPVADARPEPAAPPLSQAPRIPSPQPTRFGERILAKLTDWLPRSPKLRAAEEALQESQGTIASLETQLKESVEFADLASEEHAKEAKRAKEAETELALARDRIAELERRFDELGLESDLPVAWSEFADWCDRRLVGKVMLTDRAKREVRKPKYKDVAGAARALLWLGGKYREQRLHGGDGDLRGPNSVGLFNELCGGSTFNVKWGGQRVEVRWHLKNGGNTHDPTRCLRIYYFWDELNDQVVIASMPAHHRVTGR